MHKALAVLCAGLLLGGCAAPALQPPEPLARVQAAGSNPPATPAGHLARPQHRSSAHPLVLRQADPAHRARPLAVGQASYYASRLQGRRTASGERLDLNQLTGAHPDLPFGSRVRVTNLANQRSVVVRINDRGPFGGRRVIDVSRRAAEQLGMLRSGTARVQLTLEAP